MSEHITHVAICQDVRLLCLALDDLPAEFKQAWTAHNDASNIGGVTREADRWSVQVVAHVRDQLALPPGTPRDPHAMRKLAFVLGALTHRSIDRHMKPVFAFFKQSTDARIVDGRPFNECTIYCDLLVLKHVIGDRALFPPGLLGVGSPARPKQLHELLRQTFQRVLIQMHTFRPDSDDVHAWMSAVFAGPPDFDLRLDLGSEKGTSMLCLNPLDVRRSFGSAIASPRLHPKGWSPANRRGRS